MAKRAARRSRLDRDAGFKAAKAWFEANEAGMDEREQILAQEIGRQLGIGPNVLCGKLRHLREHVDTVGLRADAENWSDEMRKIEFDRVVDLAIEQLRTVPAIERAITAAMQRHELPTLVLAELPIVVWVMRKHRPAAKPQK